MKKIIITLASALIIAGCGKDPLTPTPPPTPPTPTEPDTELIYPAPENNRFLRMAYFPSYQYFNTVDFPDEMLNTVDVACYAFATINDNLTVTLNNPSHYNIQDLVNRCHAKGIKIVLSFNGTWLDKRFGQMVATKALRTKFIDSVMKIVNTYGFDGVDNDWEYPSGGAANTKKGNLLLMREFSNILHAPGVNKILSMALTSGKYEGDYTKGIDKGVYDCCDWMGVMAYDDSNPHSSMGLLQAGYNFWVKKAGMPKSKFVGGMPCYGRGTGDYWNKSKTYKSLLENYGADPDEDTVMTDGYQTNYNGRKTIAAKVEYLFENETGGYFFWEAGQDITDERSLLKTADAKLKELQGE